MASDQDKQGKDVKAKDIAKPGFNIVEFARETRREIAKVTWPSRKETILTTVVVVVMALIASVFFFGVDTALGYIIGHLLGMSS